MTNAFLGKISTSVLQNTQQEYAWAAGDCQNEFQRMDLDDAESFYNQYRTLIIKKNLHNRGFIDESSRQIINIHE